MALRRATWQDVISYRVDNWMAWNPLVKVLALGVATAALVVLGAVCLAYVAEKADAGWTSWSYIVDSSAHAGEEAWSARWTGFGVTMGGLIMFALLIGLVSDGLAERVESLKKGKSRVVESGHTLIVGWGEKVIPLIRQLCLANRSRGGGVIVILSEHDKEEMEQEIQDAVRDFLGSTVVCRQGNSMDLADLEKVAADEARAIIVIAEHPGATDADAHAIRTVLALKRALTSVSGHVVVEVADEENARILKTIGGAQVEPVLARNVIGRLMIQSFRQHGLAHALDALLSFEGDELYLKEWPELRGKTFGEAARSFPAAVICGVLHRGADGGRVELNPPDDLVLAAGDELLAIAEDDDSYAPAPPVAAPPGEPPAWKPPERKPERLLFCGWRRNMGELIRELDNYVVPGSSVTVLAETPLDARGEELQADGGLAGLENLEIIHRLGSPTRRADLVEVGAAGFESAIVLADETDDLDAQEIDSRVLICLLLIRDLQREAGREGNLISEIRDSRTKLLISLAKVSDYVVSSEIVSEFLAQLAERQDMAKVWRDLLDAGGNEVYVKDARLYAAEGEELSFHELHARARRRKEVAIGYRGAADVEPVLNPKDKLARRRYAAGDSVIVIATGQD